MYAHGGYAYFLALSAIVLHFVGCCLYIEAVATHIGLMLTQIDDEYDLNQKNKENAKTKEEIISQLNDVISAHIQIMK